MKLLTALSVLCLLSISLSTPLIQAQDDDQENLRTFMRVKLKHAQNVLEALTLEDYGNMAKSAQELSLLSHAAQWQVVQTPEYVRRSVEFRNATDALTEAARQRNLDGATLQYVKMTMRCIECHKYVRTVGQANLKNHFSSKQKALVRNP